MGNKVARRTLELLIDRAKTQHDWDVVKYALDDYLEEGYRIQDMVFYYNSAYKEWCSEQRDLKKRNKK